MDHYRTESDRQALGIIYGFLSHALLTNPECTFLSEGYPLLSGMSFSRAAGSIPPSLEEFTQQALAVRWNTATCVAGTEPTDTRRNTLHYRRTPGSLVLDFPASGRLSPAEAAVKEWIKDALKEERGYEG